MIKKKNVLILGASSDIGLETINRFLEHKSYNLYLHCYKNSKRLKKIKNDQIIKKFNINLNNLASVKKFIQLRKKDLKKIDIFVSLTGYLVKDKKNDFSDEKNILDHIRANYISNLIFLKFILPNMKKRKFGRVLLSSSIGIKFGGSLYTSSYSISKYLNEFFLSAYQKFYQKNLFLNTIRIGVTNTKIHKKTPNKNMKKRISMIPTKKIASSEEVSRYIYFYASEENKLTNKQIIDISGGE